MRNLKLLKSLRSSKLQGPDSPQCVAVRADTGSLLLASHFSITEYDPRTGQVVSEASLTADGYFLEDGSRTVVGLQDLAELESACLATAGGDVILFNLNTCEVSSTEKLGLFFSAIISLKGCVDVNVMMFHSWSVSAAWTAV
ncbi:elongator complex protein 1-like [Symphorus nematophorus]